MSFLSTYVKSVFIEVYIIMIVLFCYFSIIYFIAKKNNNIIITISVRIYNNKMCVSCAYNIVAARIYIIYTYICA